MAECLRAVGRRQSLDCGLQHVATTKAMVAFRANHQESTMDKSKNDNKSDAKTTPTLKRIDLNTAKKLVGGRSRC